VCLTFNRHKEGKSQDNSYPAWPSRFLGDWTCCFALQVQQAQQQFQQMQQLAQMQQQFQQQYSGAAVAGGAGNLVMSPGFSPSRRGRKPTDKKKRKRHTWVKRPTTAYLYFVSKYRETLKEAGEVVPKVG